MGHKENSTAASMNNVQNVFFRSSHDLNCMDNTVVKKLKKVVLGFTNVFQ